jgi:glycosyltransferase involved in cell wall biosynthesis
MTAQRIAAFPPGILKDRNPYARLLYREMENLGFAVVDESPLELGRLLGMRREVDMMHFHWDPQQKYVHRTPDRMTRLLRRFGLARLVPWWETVSFTGLLLVARMLGYRIAWTIHEIHPHESDTQRQDLFASRALARLSHLLIAHDNATADRARRELRCPSAEIHVVPHGSYVGEYPAGRPRDIVRTELGIPHDAFVFLAFGHLRAYKDLPRLFDAFASVSSQQTRLVVAGVPWDAEVRKKVSAAAERDPRIHLMLGPVPVEGVAELFGACDTAVFPRSDGWTSGSLILALSMGIPVVAAMRPAYAELMDGETAGWLFDPDNESSLCDCMEAAASDRESARNRGAQGLALARRMSWASAASMTARLLAPAGELAGDHRFTAPASAMQRT